MGQHGVLLNDSSRCREHSHARWADHWEWVQGVKRDPGRCAGSIAPSQQVRLDDAFSDKPPRHATQADEGPDSGLSAVQDLHDVASGLAGTHPPLVASRLASENAL
jgi:hypothetical protein